MGMIEKAIKHFEALQKRYTKQHNGKMCEYVKIALDAMYKENELVRCKDCKHSHYLSGAKKYACRHPLYTGGNKHGGDHFCGYGEKREV